MRNGAQRILLADDLRNFLDLEVSFLKRADVTVLTANDGIEALKMAKQEKPNLILLDIEMPRMSGLECCRILKRDPVLNRTPLIIISANQKRDEALRAGCDEYLEKPITEAQLLTEIQKFLPLRVRREPRVAVSVEARYTVGKQSVTAYSSDLSAAGCFLVTREVLPLGRTVTLTLYLPPHQPSPYQIEALVTRVAHEEIRGRTVQGIGLEFRGLSPEVLTLIEQLVQASQAKPSAHS